MVVGVSGSRTSSSPPDGPKTGKGAKGVCAVPNGEPSGVQLWPRSLLTYRRSYSANTRVGVFGSTATAGVPNGPVGPNGPNAIGPIRPPGVDAGGGRELGDQVVSRPAVRQKVPE